MDWMYLFYFLLATLVFFGSKCAARGEWNEEYTSLRQTKILQGITALGIALHHMAQKTCAPWHPRTYMVHGLDPFLSMGYMFVGVFLFCSGLGLYKSFKSKPGYLKGFFRRRILPIIIAFYLSEIIYTIVRLAMGEKMNALTVLWYLSGLHMANFNAWYVIVIPFFYLVFRTAFRFCKREGVAILWVFLFTLGYTVLGAFIDHQNDWWMRGEWWYNSIILFPLGLLFAKYEKPVTAFLKKGYLFWLLLSFAAIFLLFTQSEWLNDNAWGYYGEVYDRLKVQHRLMSAGFQWLVTCAYVAFCFLFMMKVRLGNRALAWLGGMTLEFYLMHGIFVELFGFNFLDISKSLVYIKKVAPYTAVVLACSIPATLLFSLFWKSIVRLTRKRDPEEKRIAAAKAQEKARRKRLKKLYAEQGKLSKIKPFIVPGIAVLLLSCYLLPTFGGGSERVRVMSGLEFTVPENYSLRYADTDYASWEYTGKDKKPGSVILDANVRGSNVQYYSTIEDVLADCSFLTEAEVYVNPQGIRMVRGFADYSGSPERRYYIETSASVLLLCMLENEQFYNRGDCESAMVKIADSVRRVK